MDSAAKKKKKNFKRQEGEEKEEEAIINLHELEKWLDIFGYQSSWYGLLPLGFIQQHMKSDRCYNSLFFPPSLYIYVTL